MAKYYDKEGEPISLLTWSQLFEFPKYRQIASDNVDSLWVSTVWLGLDHAHGVGPPLIFETMVFDTDNFSGHDLDMERYSTLEQAIAGHARMVEKVRQP